MSALSRWFTVDFVPRDFSVAEMDEIKIAYLAGVVDGEGTITIHKHKFYGREAYQLRPRLIVSNTDAALLKELQRRHGGTITSHREATAKSKKCYLWRVAAIDEIFNLVSAMRPHLLVKGKQADLILDFLRSRRAARMTGQKKFRPYLPRDFAAFEAIKIENRRTF